ncbi:MAG: hydroxymethylbilane synthase, partial [Desulfobacterota bacterium]|nr:hydroxymethylbilane synthase [Thermodesulfobacteriota bacterium]
MKTTFFIGTRGSPLAIKQAEWVANQLIKKYPQFDFNLIKIKTKGDKVYDALLAKLGGKGIFVKEIEEALIEKKIDLAVHRLKNVPVDFPEELSLSAIPPRENPLDVLISQKG